MKGVSVVFEIVRIELIWAGIFEMVRAGIFEHFMGDTKILAFLNTQKGESWRFGDVTKTSMFYSVYYPLFYVIRC